MDKTIDLTIIIPIYNVEKYLDDCMNSINHAFDKSNIEILLIDDGSKDSSGEIAGRYGKEVKNIYAFHKENGGLSDARNYGLSKSKGRYVFFLDSDDIVDSEQFMYLINAISSMDEDVILWDAEVIDENGNILDDFSEKYYCHSGLKSDTVYDGLTAIIKQLDDHKDYVTTVWLGAYKKDYLTKYGFWFEFGLLHEDEMWTPKVLMKASLVKYLPLKLYKYRIRKNSIMNNKIKDKSKNINDLIYIFSTLYNYLDWFIEDKKTRKLLKANVTKRYLHKIADYNVCTYRELYGKIHRKELLYNSIGMKDLLRSFLLCVSGRVYCKVSRAFVDDK